MDYLQVLSGDTQAAEMLAAEVHRDISVDEVNTDTKQLQLDLPLEQCGMWIDPIGMTHIHFTQHFVMFPNQLITKLSPFINQNFPILYPINCRQPALQSTYESFHLYDLF
jgi:hypothetical protein